MAAPTALSPYQHYLSLSLSLSVHNTVIRTAKPHNYTVYIRKSLRRYLTRPWLIFDLPFYHHYCNVDTPWFTCCMLQSIEKVAPQVARNQREMIDNGIIIYTSTWRYSLGQVKTVNSPREVNGRGRRRALLANRAVFIALNIVNYWSARICVW